MMSRESVMLPRQYSTTDRVGIQGYYKAARPAKTHIGHLRPKNPPPELRDPTAKIPNYFGYCEPGRDPTADPRHPPAKLAVKRDAKTSIRHGVTLKEATGHGETLKQTFGTGTAPSVPT